ncbi:type I-G CRISPR-associated protein Csb2 [Desulfogranum marinum]|uniref:type I-G CRISPR-associated protein Csb2 n=1 Tax=Desulfogranum marinum TaxID=453220 RepID=UPI001963976A|nr:type I-U CRISPR-associated protein Csb2 [Desulfogranum marinum]MBM9514721.1 type I-U CRISPR-associated protein Cas5/Cas6 [Desulfogranum marinum]
MDMGVQIEFLVTPQLSIPSSPKYGEWPPAPDRVFQALVATAAETGQNMDVLRYLESAPTIKASDALAPPAPVRYVPDNFKRTKRYHQGAARHLPTVHPKSNTVLYIWKDMPEEVAEPIRLIVTNLTHIGRATSFVRGSLVTKDMGNGDWIPDEHGDLLLRAPYPGRLDHLCEAYAAGLRSSAAPSVGYRKAHENYFTTSWGDLMVLRPERQLALTETVYWTSKIRQAVMSLAPEDMPALIHGHGNHRHVAWTALPDVGHKYASGGIIGLGCWLPSDVTGHERALLGSIFMKLTKLDNIQLRIDSFGLKGLQQETWNRASRKWATVTPIALDRWPKKNKSAEQIISDSLVAMDLPAPLNITCSNESPLKKAANARKYPSRKGNRFITHAVIEWKNSISGPLLVGADRYFGSGLCRPIQGR